MTHTSGKEKTQTKDEVISGALGLTIEKLRIPEKLDLEKKDYFLVIKADDQKVHKIQLKNQNHKAFELNEHLVLDIGDVDLLPILSFNLVSYSGSTKDKIAVAKYETSRLVAGSVDTSILSFNKLSAMIEIAIILQKQETQKISVPETQTEVLVNRKSIADEALDLHKHVVRERNASLQMVEEAQSSRDFSFLNISDSEDENDEINHVNKSKERKSSTTSKDTKKKHSSRT
eukprot:c241_g1_i1.p1 GENE.c241_g1_i1~~c241_g1_i1.p1  ORF type:complete len:243 (+),score=74.26 c241_g1_i1:38-730(+)